MSRVGKKIISLDKNVEVTINGNQVVVKGPNGTLSMQKLDFVTVNVEPTEITIEIENPKDKLQRAMWGTTRSILSNLIQGASTGFTKEIELNGVGFKMDLQGNDLVLNIGFSHQVRLPIPNGVKLTIVKNLITGTSADKQLLNNFFGNMHELKPCDPYKHKGFKFPGRFYIKKVGKKGGKAK